MKNPPARDSVIPGSARRVIVHEEYVLVTVRCGRCAHEQEARATARTSRCTACGRTCRLPLVPPDVTPLRRIA